MPLDWLVNCLYANIFRFVGASVDRSAHQSPIVGVSNLWNFSWKNYLFLLFFAFFLYMLSKLLQLKSSIDNQNWLKIISFLLFFAFCPFWKRIFAFLLLFFAFFCFFCAFFCIFLLFFAFFFSFFLFFRFLLFFVFFFRFFAFLFGVGVVSLEFSLW